MNDAETLVEVPPHDDGTRLLGIPPYPMNAVAVPGKPGEYWRHGRAIEVKWPGQVYPAARELRAEAERVLLPGTSYVLGLELLMEGDWDGAPKDTRPVRGYAVAWVAGTHYPPAPEDEEHYGYAILDVRVAGGVSHTEDR